MTKLLTSPISRFCKKRKIDGRMKDAFSAWIRSTYAEKFRLGKDGETVHVLLNRLSDDDLEDAWKDFTKDLKNYLT